MSEGHSYGNPPPPAAGGNAPAPSDPAGRLHRSRDDRMIGGVCGGLGRALRVDPVIFRIVLAVLAVFGGVGLLLYGAAWLLIPDDGTDESEGARLIHGQSSAAALVAAVVGIVGILAVYDLTGTSLSGGLPVLLVIAVVAAVVVGRRPGGWLNRPAGASTPQLPPWSRNRAMVAPVAIVAGVVALVLLVGVARVALRVGFGDRYGYGDGYAGARDFAGLLALGAVATCVVAAVVIGRRHFGTPTGGAGFFGPGPNSTTTGGSSQPAPDYTAPLGPPAGFSPSRPAQATRPVWTPPAPRAPREPSFVLPLALCLAVVAVGVLLGLGASGRVDVTAQVLFAAALLATGLGLVAAAWLGRGRLLIPVGVVLTLGLVIAAVVNVPLRGGVGSRQASATTVANLQSHYRLGVGDENLDLTGLALAGQTAHVDVTVGVGQLVVSVPDDVKVVVHAYAGAGQTQVFGVDQNGTRVDHTTILEPVSGRPAQQGELDLDLRVGAGNVRVIGGQS